MMKKTLAVLSAGVLAILLCACNYTAANTTQSTDAPGVTYSAQIDDAGTVDGEKTDIPQDLEYGVNTLKISCTEGTDECWSFNGNVLTFAGLDADTVCTLQGEFNGQIIIDAVDYKLELELNGAKLYCADANPVEILSGSKVTLTAKKDSKNYIYDTRSALDADDEAHTAAVWADCNLDIEGKGELTVISAHNCGVHTKENLDIKNITLSVTSAGYAVKGNERVEIQDGTITLISKQSDGIKTSDTDIGQKGNRHGNVVISGGCLAIYAACDGIDAAFDAEISGQASVSIYTDKYSPYSDEVTQTDDGDDKRYIRFTSKNYSFSVKYYNSDTDYRWVNAVYSKSVNGGRSTYYYYTVEKLTQYNLVQFFIYSASQTQGQDADYTVKSDYMTWNTAYDTFALEQRGSSLSYSWTNYSAGVNDGGWGGPGGGGPGGWGPGGDGNTEKGEYSTKGIKAGNGIYISGGTLDIKAYDDAIHANGDAVLEDGTAAAGDVIIYDGSVTVYSDDDGLHADGSLVVCGGNVAVTHSYEGFDGNTVTVSGGNISIVSSDDGINSTANSGAGVTFEGGNTYIYAGGDGIDANSRTAYCGIVFNGGEVTVINTTQMNSSLDTEQGYTYNGGKVLAICPSRAMTSEAVNCKSFLSVGTKTTMSLKADQKVTVKVNGTEVLSVTMPCDMSSFVVYLGASNAAIGAY